MSNSPAWNDPALAVASDDSWKARYRRLQSWYRTEKLGAAPGPSGTQALVGSMLAEHAVLANPSLNFFDERVAAYAETRAAQVKASDGTLDLYRLRHNMLSSMPLCFNIFGFLRDHRQDSAPVLAHALNLPIHAIDEIEVEWAPPRDQHLGDRTAFDAFVSYRTADQRKGFVGIETKYTEPFSATEYDCDAYRALTRPPVFKDGAADRLVGRATNQLWRNLLLALSVRAKGGFDLAHVAVFSCYGDSKARAAVEGVRRELADPDAWVRAASFEDVISGFAAHPSTASWAAWFRERYLDWERLPA